MTTEKDIIAVEYRSGKSEESKRMDVLWWAVVLIWAGLIFGADSLGILPRIDDASAWSWVFLGAGMLSVFGSLYRLASLEVPNPTAWDWIWGAFCLIVGLGGFTTFTIAWPLILILVGGVILVSAIWQRD